MIAVRATRELTMRALAATASEESSGLNHQ
jgi:hypothetical protein